MFNKLHCLIGRERSTGSFLDRPSSLKREILDGIWDGLLFVPLYLPLAVPYALLAGALHLSALSTVLWSALSFACSAQLACLTALAASAGLPEILIITFMANIRHGFVGMAITPYLQGLSKSVLPLFCFTICSTSAGLIPLRAKEQGAVKFYGFATQICQWLQWVLFTLAAVCLGRLIPTSWERVLGFAVPAAFLGLICSMVQKRRRSGVLVALVAAILSIAFSFLMSQQISLIGASIAASAGGLLVTDKEYVDEAP